MSEVIVPFDTPDQKLGNVPLWVMELPKQVAMVHPLYWCEASCMDTVRTIERVLSPYVAKMVPDE